MMRPVHLPLAVIALTTLSASALAQAPSTTAEPGQAKQIIQNWPDTSKQAAEAMIQKYGGPGEVTPTMLIWENSGPWMRTIVYKQEIDHDFPMPHKDVLEQFIPYKVPVELFDDLAAYDGSVIVERTKGEISARCDKEAANFLAINLAHDIVTGKKTVDQARQAYADTMKMVMEGKSPEITQKFTFDVNRDYKGDPGKAIMSMAKQ